MEFFVCLGILRERDLTISVDFVMGFSSMISLPLWLALCWVFQSMASGSCELVCDMVSGSCEMVSGSCELVCDKVCLVQLCVLEGGGTRVWESELLFCVVMLLTFADSRVSLSLLRFLEGPLSKSSLAVCLPWATHRSLLVVQYFKMALSSAWYCCSASGSMCGEFICVVLKGRVFGLTF